MTRPTLFTPRHRTQSRSPLATPSRWQRWKPPLTPRLLAILALAVLGVVSAILCFVKWGSTRHGADSRGRQSADGSPPPGTPTAFDTANPLSSPAALSIIPDDDHKIDEVLRLCASNPVQNHTSTAQVLINLLPTLTAQGQIQGARHIANLLPDHEYHRVMHLWRNPSANREVIEIFGTDLMNRDPNLMLPAMLEALRQRSHPFHDRGKQTLQLFLDADHGSDFAKWDAALQDFADRRAIAKQSASDDPQSAPAPSEAR